MINLFEHFNFNVDVTIKNVNSKYENITYFKPTTKFQEKIRIQFLIKIILSMWSTISFFLKKICDSCRNCFLVALGTNSNFLCHGYNFLGHKYSYVTENINICVESTSISWSHILYSSPLYKQI